MGVNDYLPKVVGHLGLLGPLLLLAKRFWHLIHKTGTRSL